MKRRRLLLLPALVASILTSTDANDMSDETGARIQGVWKIESMDVGIGPNSRTEVPRAFMFFFAKNHYSAIRDFAPPGESGTESDAAPSRGKFMADAGTYEIDGDDLVVHHMVAGFPALGSMTFGWAFEDDDTLILTPQYDKMVMPGIDLKPKDGKMGYGDVATRYVFRRLE